MKLSTFLAAAGWISLLILTWMIVLRSVPAEPVTTGLAWVFFLLFSASASTIQSMPKKG